MTHALLATLSRLPRPLLAAVAAVLGDAWFFLVRVRRQQALDNVSASSLDPGPARRRRLVRRCCRHLVLNVLELPRLLGLDDRRFFAEVEVQGAAHLRAAAAEGRGVLVVTAHLGNWELLGSVSSRLGFDTRLLTRPMAGAGSRHWVRQQRRCSGAVEIEEDAADLRRVIAELRAARVVGLTVDQRLPGRRRAVLGPFLGRRTRLSRAAALVALRTGCPVVVVTTHRRGRSGHVVRIDAPLRPDRSRSPGTAADALTLRIARAIERAIARTPEQWLWHHRRWADVDAAQRSPDPVPAAEAAWSEGG